MNRGIIMEQHAAYSIVLTPDGEYRKVKPIKGFVLGDEFELSESKPIRRPLTIWGGSLTAAAACVLLVLLLPRIWMGGTSEAALYLTLDVNPSIEIGLTRNQEVVELTGLNEDGYAIVSSVSYAGKNVYEVSEELARELAERSYLSGDAQEIVITSVLNDEGLQASIQEAAVSALENAIVSADEANLVEFIKLEAPKSVREASRESGLSTGKYAIYLLAQEQGINVTKETLENQSIAKATHGIVSVKKLVEGSAVKGQMGPELERILTNTDVREENKGKPDKAKPDKAKPGKSNPEKEKSSKEKAEKEKQEKEKQEKEKQEKEKQEKEKQDKDKPEKVKKDKGNKDNVQTEKKTDDGKPEQGKPGQEKPDKGNPDKGNPDRSRSNEQNVNDKEQAGGQQSGKNTGNGRHLDNEKNNNGNNQKDKQEKQKKEKENDKK